MTEEEAGALHNAFADLQKAFHELKVVVNDLQEQVRQKEQRIEELESQVLRERLRNLELENAWRKTVITVANRLLVTGIDAKGNGGRKARKTVGGKVVIRATTWPRCQTLIR